jgi:hypothetical protein
LKGARVVAGRGAVGAGREAHAAANGHTPLNCTGSWFKSGCLFSQGRFHLFSGKSPYCSQSWYKLSYGIVIVICIRYQLVQALLMAVL